MGSRLGVLAAGRAGRLVAVSSGDETEHHRVAHHRLELLLVGGGRQAAGGRPSR